MSLVGIHQNGNVNGQQLSSIFLLSSRFKIALCDTAVSHDTAAE